MKNVIKMLIFSALCLLGLNSSVQACSVASVGISGPSGRCVSTGVPLTYTGTHNFSSSACTVYEWTIQGGTLTEPGGIFVTNGTLCIIESLTCIGEAGFNCDMIASSSSIASGSGADVSVVWAPGTVTGSLSLTVKEVTSGTEEDSEISRSRTITIDNSIPVPTSITRLSGTNTFRANYPADTEFCDGSSVRWTINGSSAGSGNPRTLSFSPCADATICAFTRVNGVNSASVCTFVPGRSTPGAIFGPNQIQELDPQSYTFSITNGPVGSTNWFVQGGAGNITGSGTTVQLTAFNAANSPIDICVSGTWGCGNYTVCKEVEVLPFSPTRPNSDARPKAEDDVEGESQQRNRNFSLDANVTQELSVFPSPATAGQEVTINLPDYNGQRVAVNVTDIQGRVVYENQTDQRNLLLRTEDLPKGIYVLTVYSGETVESKKFMIQ